jgi:hypothetical protein
MQILQITAMVYELAADYEMFYNQCLACVIAQARILIRCQLVAW